MDKIIERSSLVYFTDLIWFCATLLAIYIGIKNFKKETSFFLFQTYLFIAFLLTIWIHGIKLFVPMSKINKSIIQENCNITFSFIEITAVLYFFRAIQNSKKGKKIITAIWVISVLATILAAAYMNIDSTSNYNNQKYSLIITNLSFVISILLSLNYFYRLLTNRLSHIGPLTNSPSFWITSGLFFYSIVSLPALLLSPNFFISNKDLYHILFGIHYISITIFFLCIAKAFLCKTPLTT